MHDLATFGVRDLKAVSAEMRRLAEGARSMEEVADRVVWHQASRQAAIKTNNPNK